MGSYYGAVYYGEYSTEGLDSSLYGRVLKLISVVTQAFKLSSKIGV